MTQRVLITTVVRYADLAQDSGFVRVLDLASGEMLMTSPMPESLYRAQDPNPRGGLRGARGVSVWGDRLVLANTERLLIFDEQWQPVRQITHPLMGGVHDILAEEDGIWITCTNADLLIKISWGGEVLAHWSWREDAHLPDQLGLPGVSSVDMDLDYRDPETMRDGVRNMVHLNGVARCPAGLLLSFGRILSPTRYRQARMQSVVGRIAKKVGVKRRNNRAHALTPQPVGLIEGSSAGLVLLRESGEADLLSHVPHTRVPNHNVWQAGDKLLYNDSNESRLVALPWSGNGETQAIVIPGEPGFARGLAQLDETRFLSGSQAPAAVYEADFATQTVTRTYLLAGKTHETVYGLCLLPDHFAMPPPHLGI